MQRAVVVRDRAHHRPVTEIGGFPRMETLKGGLAVTIRPLRPDDRAKIAAAVHNLDRESVYFRLFSYRSELTERGLDRIMAVAPGREVVLVVTQGEGAGETVIGSGRLVESDVNDGEGRRKWRSWSTIVTTARVLAGGS